MTIEETIELLKNGESITIGDKQFDPISFDEIRLISGEMLYFAEDDNQGVLLSIDQDSDEIIMFQKIEDDLEVEDETIVYGGSDYELSLESEGNIIVDDNEIESISFKDFENGSGDKIRLVEYGAGGDIRGWSGSIVIEDELKEIL